MHGTGLGVAVLVARSRRPWFERAAVLLAGLGLAGIGIGSMARDMVHPFKTTHDLRAREFARWFWPDQARHAELVCVWTDLRQGFFPQTYAWRSMAQYLCNQRIYSPRHRHGASLESWADISAARPLRCAVFNLPGRTRDETAFSRWLARMESRYELADRRQYDLSEPGEGAINLERVEVYEFIQKRTADAVVRQQGKN